MSHTTTIDAIMFTDMGALQAAINELKATGVDCELMQNLTTRAYYNNQQGMGTADYVVKLNDAKYDVGLYASEDGGGYEARTDFYGGTVEKQLGVQDAAVAGEQRKLGKLYQMYGVHGATRIAVQQGYAVNSVHKEDGTIQLRVAA